MSHLAHNLKVDQAVRVRVADRNDAAGHRMPDRAYQAVALGWPLRETPHRVEKVPLPADFDD